jgi:hypothetical protein
MWNKPTKNQLQKIPPIYDTAVTPAAEKVIHMHFFIGGCDWYVAEFDGEDSFFGFVILHNDEINAEWGYFSLSELMTTRINPGLEIDREVNWKPVPAGEIPRIAHLIAA